MREPYPISWSEQNRRMSKDHERLAETDETLDFIAIRRMMATRLARDQDFSDSLVAGL